MIAETPGATHSRMTNFPTRQHFFDSIWPEVNYFEDTRVLVPTNRDSDYKALESNIDDNPNCQFLLVVEGFDLFFDNLPANWLRMPPDGGIPRNVWIGAAVGRQKDVDERVRRLMKMRARKLFIMLKRPVQEGIYLDDALVAWRCSNCGRKEGFGRMLRPKECPSGSICEGSTLNPQIHWVVSMDPIQGDKIAKLCAKRGVAFWDSKSYEVPE